MPQSFKEATEAIGWIQNSLSLFPPQFQLGQVVWIAPAQEYGVIIGLHSDSAYSEDWSYLVHPAKDVLPDDEPDEICWYDRHQIASRPPHDDPDFPSHDSTVSRFTAPADSRMDAGQT